MTTVFVLNGPNLNLLGGREPEVYGTATLADVERLCRETAAELGLTVDFRQSNREGELVDWLQEAGAAVAAGPRSARCSTRPRTATPRSRCPTRSQGARLPVVEVHISNVHQREQFRHHSYVSAVAAGVVIGFGVTGYPLAIRGLHALHG